jgi:hypothetical protein
MVSCSIPSHWRWTVRHGGAFPRRHRQGPGCLSGGTMARHQRNPAPRDQRALWHHAGGYRHHFRQRLSHTNHRRHSALAHRPHRYLIALRRAMRPIKPVFRPPGYWEFIEPMHCIATAWHHQSGGSVGLTRTAAERSDCDVNHSRLSGFPPARAILVSTPCCQL